MTKHSEITEPSNSTKPVLANRIFKLRAWVRNELMVNVVSIDFNNEFITWDDNQYDRCVPPNKCYEIETFEDIVLMQFTGFVDKKGNDIYKGDILRFDFHSKSYEVIWYDGAYYLRNGNQNARLSTTSLSGYYVVGNVFESPETLLVTQADA